MENVSKDGIGENSRLRLHMCGSRPKMFSKDALADSGSGVQPAASRGATWFQVHPGFC